LRVIRRARPRPRLTDDCGARVAQGLWRSGCQRRRAREAFWREARRNFTRKRFDRD
jgi:hypothetical protein